MYLVTKFAYNVSGVNFIKLNENENSKLKHFLNYLNFENSEYFFFYLKLFTAEI